MNIADRAREALENATPGPWELEYTDPAMGGQHWRIRQRGKPDFLISGYTYGFDLDADLAALAPELAAEVVRLHDCLTKLADGWREIAMDLLPCDDGRALSGAADELHSVLGGAAMSTEARIVYPSSRNEPFLDCWCHYCHHQFDELMEKLHPDRLASSPFIVCPECGNKRCPRATRHSHDCSGSNAPGQYGSIYGGFNILTEVEW